MYVSEIDLSKKWHCYESYRPSHSERFACCALTIQYIICSTVGQLIALIYDLGKHTYLGILRLSEYGATVVYIGNGPPYRTIYITYYTTGILKHFNKIGRNLGMPKKAKNTWCYLSTL